MAEQGINLNYTYPSFLRKDGKPDLIFNTDELEKSEQALRAKGFQVIENMAECERE